MKLTLTPKTFSSLYFTISKCTCPCPCSIICFNSLECSIISVGSSSCMVCKARASFSTSFLLGGTTATRIRGFGKCISSILTSLPLPLSVLLVCVFFNFTVTPKSPAFKVVTNSRFLPSEVNI